MEVKKEVENSQEILGEATFRKILEGFGKFLEHLEKGKPWKILEEARREGHLPSRKERFRKILEDIEKSWKILEKQTFKISWEK